MSSITSTVAVNATLAAAWEAISHLGRVQRWNPLVKRAQVLSAEPTGVGARRRCELHDGTSVVETVTASKEGETVQIEMSEFSMPFNRATALTRVKELGPEHVEISFTFDFDVKDGMDAEMVKPAMSNLFAQVLAGLDQHLFTGELIEDVGSLTAA
jgi:ribosome-associated toxin RatA of RatAB toxin-antitoxin module